MKLKSLTHRTNQSYCYSAFSSSSSSSSSLSWGSGCLIQSLNSVMTTMSCCDLFATSLYLYHAPTFCPAASSCFYSEMMVMMRTKRNLRMNESVSPPSFSSFHVTWSERKRQNVVTCAVMVDQDYVSFSKSYLQQTQRLGYTLSIF